MTALLAAPAFADTIVLKNGRRIVAAQVVEEHGRVSYETSAGRLSLPRSIVDHIERGDALPAESAAELPIAPPVLEPAVVSDAAASAAVRDGAIDREYLAQVDSAARSGGAAALRAAEAHAAAAQAELRRGDMEQAVAQYRRALIFAPGQQVLLLNLAYLHLKRSEFAAALEYLERARRTAPDSADVAKLTGWAYYGLNRLDQAVAEWKRALRMRADADVQQALEKVEREEQVESEYRENESRHFNLRYFGGAAPELARGVLHALEDHFRAIESALDFTPADPIGVILYTDQDFGDITRAPGWVGALNDGRIRVPVRGLTAVTAELSRVLKHELTHSFIQQKSRGHCPVWLQEGIAQWMEGRRSGDRVAALIAAFEKKRTPPLAALESTWMNLPGETAGLAYAWSLAVTEYIVEAGGMRDVERLLDHIAAGESTEAAAREILRFDYVSLEEETAKYLRRAYLR